MKNVGTLMKRSRRRACMRRLGARVKAREITVEHASELMKYVLNGTATRRQVYGYHPTKGGSNVPSGG